MRSTAALLSVCIGGVSIARADDEQVAVTPYRPTVSTPAALSAPGWLEGEFGGLQASRAPVSPGVAPRASLPYTIKYAFTPDWGVRLGGEAVVGARDDDGRHVVGVGDTGIVAKRRVAIDDDSAFGIEAGWLAPTARRSLHLGSGRSDSSLNGIYSVDVGRWHGDANVTETRLGAHDPSASRWQTLGAVAVSRPISERWGLVAEWSGTRESAAASTAQLLGGVTLAARRDVVFDLGLAHGLDAATARWQAFAGVTLLLEHLP